MTIGFQWTRGLTFGIENSFVAFQNDILQLRGSILMHLGFFKLALVFENDENREN